MVSELVEQTGTQTIQMFKEGVPRHKILSSLARAAEAIEGNNVVCSILILDKAGLLRNGASPGLPYAYLTAIDGLKPNAEVDTCAVAAARGCMVITPDFRADDKWAELRHLPMALGFVGAWSLPIVNPQGKVLGTFGTYFRENRQPSQEEIKGIKSLAETAAGVLNRMESKSVSQKDA